ncbi:PQQ-dependent sugar dehydrogenase [Pleomorphovibrio marinus]|uniref:PQQ-dependent sugar dehydrogenase n=1 Tax=Pleomorphovibrio marinus TaxID=2164132 RepID=UPI0018E535E6|nr:PQQ-dependent sugar dehydrogenase [Pleomorphovibrio marinus]
MINLINNLISIRQYLFPSLYFIFVFGCQSPGPYDHRMPEDNRFTKITLVEQLDEPMELEVLADGSVFFIERKGKVKLYNGETGETEVVGQLDVYPEHEDGLLGMALDPKFDQNGWMYLYYSPAGSESINRLSRFTFDDRKMSRNSEVVMLEIPVFRGCCHSGGSLEFGPNGNLFLSLGDDTSPFESDNYNPIDERPGRAEAFDAQRSSGSSMDLRGGILRIKPKPDGTYSIPKGNLFPEGTPATRPEIYVLGNRNPFRISVDPKKGYLYWGEVGPDAAEDHQERGPKGYDEINQAKEAGFYGWPYFVGDNKPYWYYDFVKEESIFKYDTALPVNHSPNNTGVKELPPAQKAFIWYPYDESEEFPQLGEGGRNAMAGPVFYSDLYRDSEVKFPKYFDGKLFIYDWMRNWIFLVTMDEDGNYQKMEPFMSNTKFDKPIDMQFGRDGSLYVLEYGTFWNAQNDDAGLYRITFSEGNRPPVVNIAVNPNKGAAPLRVEFSSEGTMDHDEEDTLSYSWDFVGAGQEQSNEPNPTYVFEKPGIYRPVLTVTDQSGVSVRNSLEIQVGNEPPKVQLEVEGNRSFYWDDLKNLKYRVKVTDREDGRLETGEIAEEEIQLTFSYLAQGFDKIQATAGHQQTHSGPVGKVLMEGSDCYACHALQKASVGPSFEEISHRYSAISDQELDRLVGTIIHGGGGEWGDRLMPAHPQLEEKEVIQMVEYILSVNQGSATGELHNLPVSGSLSLDKHGPEKGTYFLSASYLDKGAEGLDPIPGRDDLQLRYAKVLAASADLTHDAAKANNKGSYLVKFTSDSAFLAFKSIDLRGIYKVVMEVDPANTSGKLELRLGSEEGELIGESPELSKADKKGESRWIEVELPLSPKQGQGDLFVVYRGPEKTSIWNGFLLNSLYFNQE